MKTSAVILGQRRSWIRTASVASCFAFGALAMAAAVAAESAAVSTSGSATATHFDLPADSLIATLRRIAELTNTEIRFDAAQLRGLQSNVVRGQFSAHDAVRKAIQGLSLVAQHNPAGGLRVDAATVLDTIVVVAKRGQGELSFKADRSATSARRDAALLELPTSVTVITNQALTSQMSTSIRDALSNVSGVTFSQSPQGRDSFQIRGFASTSLTTNGLSDGFAANIGTSAVERIEVLKGPQAILAGADALGGGVNVVTKRPQADRVNALSVQAGSQSEYVVTADLSGKVNESDARLTYRITGSHERAGPTENSFDGRTASSVMPQLRWKDGDTDLTVGAARDKSHRPTPVYTVVGQGGQLMPRPAHRIGAANDGFDSQSKRVFYDLSQRLNADMKLVSRGQYGDGSQQTHLYSLTESLKPDGTSMVYGGASDRESTTTSGDHYLQMTLATGAVDHQMSLGFAHSNSKSVSSQLDNFDHFFSISLYPSIDPGYADPRDGAKPSSTSTFVTGQRGFYLQDLMSLGNWNLMVNLRRSYYDQRGEFSVSDSPELIPAERLQRWVTTPAVGVVYKLSDETSLYASATKGFSPQTGLACGGGGVPPLTSKNQEVGMKWDLLDNKLAVTAALFNLEQSQVLEYNMSGDCYRLIDGLRTRGVEADVQGQLMPGWNLIANYSYNHINNPSDPAALFAGLPRHKFNVWSVHDVRVVSGLKVGLGITAASGTEGSSRRDTSFRLPSTARLDASISYQSNRWDLQLMVKNVTARKNYTASGSDTYVPIGAGRTVAVRLSRDFQ